MMATLPWLTENPLEHVVQHPLVQRPANLGPLTPEGEITLFSDHISMILLGGLLLVLFLPPLVRRRRGTGEVDSLVPAGPANAIEAICSYLRDEVARPVLGPYTDRFVKYIWSVFFFILTLNLLGLIPIAPLAALAGTHLGGTATGNIWVTATMALLTLGMMLYNGIRLGGRHFFAHFLPGPWWLAWVLVPVEIVGMGARIFALTVRLFANMLAGHILVAVLLGLILSAGTSGGALLGLGIAVPVVLGSAGIMLLEIFVAFLQAFIFAFLTAVFIGASVVFAGHGHDAHGEEAHAH